MALQEFKDIIKELKKIKQDESLTHLSDDILFDAATRIYNSQRISQRYAAQEEDEEEQKSKSMPMTEKQKKLLQDLDYKGTMNLTKTEASKIISEHLEDQKSREK